MRLCDIGNSYFHFWDDGRMWHEPVTTTPRAEGVIYAASVNPDGLQRLRASGAEVIDIAPWVELPGAYPGLGVDRALACLGVGHGVVIDAGSAITVDIIREGVYEGGFVLPGLNAWQRALAGISSVLDYPLNRPVAKDRLPSSTAEGVIYGVAAPLQAWLWLHAKGLMIVGTGGSSEWLRQTIEGITIVQDLIFQGMIKVIRTKGVVC
ncbi:MAG: type III pantothenate kinase [Campylobacterales bacterium]